MWVIVPLVAVMVMVPVGAEEDAVTVSVLMTAADVLAVTGLGLNEQLSPVLPLQEKLTLPENPCSEVTLMVSLVVPPAATVSVPFAEAIVKSGLVPLMVTAIGTRWEAVEFAASTLTVPVCEFAPVEVTVSVEVTAVLPFVVTGRAEHVVAVNGETAVQEMVMFDPIVPSRLRVRVAALLAGKVTLVAEGVTEKSGIPVMALIKVATSGDPNPVTRS